MAFAKIVDENELPRSPNAKDEGIIAYDAREGTLAVLAHARLCTRRNLDLRDSVRAARRRTLRSLAKAHNELVASGDTHYALLSGLSLSEEQLRVARDAFGGGGNGGDGGDGGGASATTSSPWPISIAECAAIGTRRPELLPWDQLSDEELIKALTFAIESGNVRVVELILRDYDSRIPDSSFDGLAECANMCVLPSALCAGYATFAASPAAYYALARANVCSRNLTGRRWFLQPHFQCLTCERRAGVDSDTLAMKMGVCLSCAAACHAGHELVLGEPSGFFCDCGQMEFQGADNLKCNLCEDAQVEAAEAFADYVLLAADDNNDNDVDDDYDDVDDDEDFVVAQIVAHGLCTRSCDVLPVQATDAKRAKRARNGSPIVGNRSGELSAQLLGARSSSGSSRSGTAAAANAEKGDEHCLHCTDYLFKHNEVFDAVLRVQKERLVSISPRSIAYAFLHFNRHAVARLLREPTCLEILSLNFTLFLELVLKAPVVGNRFTRWLLTSEAAGGAGVRIAFDADRGKHRVPQDLSEPFAVSRTVLGASLNIGDERLVQLIRTFDAHANDTVLGIAPLSGNFGGPYARLSLLNATLVSKTSISPQRTPSELYSVLRLLLSTRMTVQQSLAHEFDLQQCMRQSILKSTLFALLENDDFVLACVNSLFDSMSPAGKVRDLSLKDRSGEECESLVFRAAFRVDAPNFASAANASASAAEAEMRNEEALLVARFFLCLYYLPQCVACGAAHDVRRMVKVLLDSFPLVLPRLLSESNKRDDKEDLRVLDFDAFRAQYARVNSLLGIAVRFFLRHRSTLLCPRRVFHYPTEQPTGAQTLLKSEMGESSDVDWLLKRTVLAAAYYGAADNVLLLLRVFTAEELIKEDAVFGSLAFRIVVRACACQSLAVLRAVDRVLPLVFDFRAQKMLAPVFSDSERLSSDEENDENSATARDESTCEASREANTISASTQSSYNRIRQINAESVLYLGQTDVYKLFLRDDWGIRQTEDEPWEVRGGAFRADTSARTRARNNPLRCMFYCIEEARLSIRQLLAGKQFQIMHNLALNVFVKARRARCARLLPPMRAVMQCDRMRTLPSWLRLRILCAAFCGNRYGARFVDSLSDAALLTCAGGYAANDLAHSMDFVAQRDSYEREVQRFSALQAQRDYERLANVSYVDVLKEPVAYEVQQVCTFACYEWFKDASRQDQMSAAETERNARCLFFSLALHATRSPLSIRRFSSMKSAFLTRDVLDKCNVRAPTNEGKDSARLCGDGKLSYQHLRCVRDLQVNGCLECGNVCWKIPKQYR